MGENIRIRDAIFVKMNRALNANGIGGMSSAFQAEREKNPEYTFGQFVSEYILLKDGHQVKEEVDQWNAGWDRLPPIIGLALEHTSAANLANPNASPMEFDSLRQGKPNFGVAFVLEADGGVIVEIKMPFTDTAKAGDWPPG